MPKTCNPIRKRKVKQALLQGINAKQALMDAGYSVNTAINATKTSVVKHCQKEIIGELKQKDVTVELIIERLNEDRDMAIKKQDMPSVIRCDELLGKYLAMFTDKVLSDVTVTDKQEQEIIDKYNNPNRLHSN